MSQIAMVLASVSEVTGRREPATVCPELRSVNDGKLICDGIPDIDLLMMHEMGVDVHGRVLPLALCSEMNGYDRVMNGGFRPMVEQAKRKTVKSWADALRVSSKKLEREKLLEAHTARIQADEAKWNEIPQTQEEIDELMQDLELLHGITKMMTHGI